MHWVGAYHSVPSTGKGLGREAPLTEMNAGVHTPRFYAEGIFIQQSIPHGDEQATSHFFKKLILLKGPKSTHSIGFP